jgi:hypothetical protein
MSEVSRLIALILILTGMCTVIVILGKPMSPQEMQKSREKLKETIPYRFKEFLVQTSQEGQCHTYVFFRSGFFLIDTAICLSFAIAKNNTHSIREQFEHYSTVIGTAVSNANVTEICRESLHGFEKTNYKALFDTVIPHCLLFTISGIIISSYFNYYLILDLFYNKK